MTSRLSRRWLRGVSLATVSVLLGITLSFSDTPDVVPAWAGNGSVCESTGGSAHNDLKVYPSHGKVFYIDSGQNQSVDAAYAGYRVENTSGSTKSNLWAKVDSFTGGVVGLANQRDAYFRIGDVSGSQTLPAYFLLTAGVSTTTAQSHVFRVYSGDPRLSGSSELYNCTYSFVSVKETIKAAANKVTDVTTVVSNQIGGNLVVTVEGQTGTIGSGTSSPDGEVLWFTPAARSSWPSSSLSLRSTSIKFATNNGMNQNASTHVNKLVFVNPKSTLTGTANKYYYEATYTFRITGPVASSVQAIPIAQISSGTQIKHTDVTGITSDADATVSITTPVNVGVAKTVSPTIDTSGGTEKLSYTVSFTNSSGGSVDLDQIVDEPSAGLSFTAGSASFGGSSVADPVTDSSGNLVFQGPFTVSSGASETLTYQMTSTCTTGSFDYTNVAYGTIGSLVVGKNGTTVSGVRITGSCPPSTGSVTVSDQTLDPAPITQPASLVAETSATLNGSVDPNGVAGQAVTFVWGTSSSLAGGATVTLSTSTSSSDFYGVNTALTGLSAGTRYYYQVTIGGIAGEILSFVTTEAVGTPTIDTDPVSDINVSTTSVTFNGTVDPNQVAGGATVYFLYGMTGSSGASTDCSTVSYGSPILIEADTDDDGLFDDGAEIFEGAFPANFSTSVTGLTTGAYYCVYARTSWSSGTVTLDDTTPVLFRMNTMYTQTITFPTPSITSYNATETLGATVADSSGGSALTVTYGSNTPSVCTVSGGVVTIVGAGTCSLTAYQTGDASRYPAAPVTVTFTVTSYTVIYNLNGAAGSAPVDASSPYASGQNVTVTATVPSRTGYSFTGWDTQANGAGTDYATSSTLSSIAANTTLYAQWTVATTYTVTYDANGGTGAPSTSTHNQSTTVTVSATEPTRSGYRFVGWNTQAGGGGTPYVAGSGTFTISADTTLYAQWVQTFTVTYNANSATSGSVPGVTTHDTGATVTVASNSGSLVRTGYTFAGWNKQAGGGGTTYGAGSGTFTISADTVLYAKWTAVTYTVTYDGNSSDGGSVPGAQTSTGGSSVTVPANTGTLTKSGKIFGGWALNTGGTGTTYDPGSSYVPLGNITLYAVWLTPYTVTYDGNSSGGGSVPSVTTHGSGTTVTVASNSGSLVRTGYTFAGWNTQANGLGTTYVAGSGTFTISANTTLYAKWTANSQGSSGGGSNSGNNSPSVEPAPPRLLIPRILPPRSTVLGPVAPQTTQNLSPQNPTGNNENAPRREAEPFQTLAQLGSSSGISGFGTIDLGKGVVQTGQSAGTLESANRSISELANEVLGGFAPGSSTYIEIMGARTGARFVVTEAEVVDSFTLVRAIQESIEAQRADFFSIESAQVAKGPVSPKPWTNDDRAAADFMFASSGLAAPTLLSDLPIGQYTNWVLVETRAQTFVPGSTVYLTLTSEPVVLAEGVVDLNGEIQLSGTVPAELLTAGEHRVRIVGTRALEGASVDSEGEIQVSDALLQEIQRFDLGTQSTIAFFGSSATGETHAAMRVIPLVPTAPWWALIFIGLGLLLFGSLRRWGPIRKNFAHNVATVMVFLMATPAVILGWISTVTTVVWWALALGLVAMVLYYLVRPKHPTSRAS